MSNFVSIGFFDLSNFYASYIARHRRALVDSGDARHSGVRFLDLVRGREPAPLLAEWKQGAALIQRVGAQMRALPTPSSIENAFICAFDPGGFEAWTPADDQLDMAIHMLLAPAPGFRLLCGPDVVAPVPWVAVSMDPKAPQSRTNFDAPNTAHELVLEIIFDPDAGLGADRPAA